MCDSHVSLAAGPLAYSLLFRWLMASGLVIHRWRVWLRRVTVFGVWLLCVYIAGFVRVDCHGETHSSPVSVCVALTPLVDVIVPVTPCSAVSGHPRCRLWARTGVGCLVKAGLRVSRSGLV